MQITKTINNNVVILKITGDVDLSNSPNLRIEFAKLIKDKAPSILVDLSEVTYMDSSGLATLIEAMQKTTQNDGTFKLRGVTGAVKNMFEIARLNEIFAIE